MELLYLGVTLWCGAHCKPPALLPWVSSVLSVSQPLWGCYWLGEIRICRGYKCAVDSLYKHFGLVFVPVLVLLPNTIIIIGQRKQGAQACTRNSSSC